MYPGSLYWVRIVYSVSYTFILIDYFIIDRLSRSIAIYYFINHDDITLIYNYLNNNICMALDEKITSKICLTFFNKNMCCLDYKRVIKIMCKFTRL